MLTVLRGQVVLDDGIIKDGALVFDGDTISWVGEVGDAQKELDLSLAQLVEETPPSSQLILPGLVDVHCHGGGGVSFPNAQTTDEAMIAVVEHRRHGTTSLVASLVTAAPDILLRQTRLLAKLGDEGEIAGIHFEGPFVSKARCGAQDPEFIIDPDVDLTESLLDAAGGHAVTMTVAPEKPGAYGVASVADTLRNGGAIPSWGHTDAQWDDARDALLSDSVSGSTKDVGGVRSADRVVNATVTHMFNGMKPFNHRDPGPIAEFLRDASQGGILLELICDGVHVCPALVKTVVDLVGRDQVVFVTDAMAAAGMADGSYQLGPQAVTVKDGVARLSDGSSIAGGTAHLLDCIRIANQEAGINLVDAVYMASAQGARVLQSSQSIGRLRAGYHADAVCIDEDFSVRQVWRGGNLVR